MENILIKKKLGNFENFQPEKIHKAIKKSASRVFYPLTIEECKKVSDIVYNKIKGQEIVDIKYLHLCVENALDEAKLDKVAKSYREYRNYRKDAADILDAVHKKSYELENCEDKSNANTDSSLVSTKRSIKYNEYSKAEYEKFFINDEERQAFEEGFIYIHDIGSRLDTYNCGLENGEKIMKNGFTLATMDYVEPKSVDVSIDVLSDIISTTAGNQYGGLTIPQIDEILISYCEKSYNKFIKEYKEDIKEFNGIYNEELVDKKAYKKIKRDICQRIQGIEHTFNSVSSSRGDFPFITFTFGHSTNRWAKLVSECILEVRMGGQGKQGAKIPVVFPKLVFLYDKDLHGEDKELEILFDLAIECNKVSQYPDFLSLDAGYIGEVYHKWGKIISPMGAVISKNVVTYKYNNILYVEAFERMWNRLCQDFEDKGQNGDENSPHRYIDLKNVNIKIYDTKEKDFVKINYIWCNQVKASDLVDVKLYTKEGKGSRYIRVTKDHPFTTQRGDVKAKDLKKDDKILINKSQYSEETKIVSKELAWLLGAMLCDGCYQNYICYASFGKDEQDIVDYFCKCFKKEFNLSPKVKLQERGEKGTYIDCNINTISFENYKSHDLEKLVKYFENIFGGLQKKFRQIPNEVFSWNREAKLAFLAGMIDADGYIHNPLRAASEVEIGSTNKELAYQQMALAQSLGYACSCCNNYYSNRQDKTRIAITFKVKEELLNYLQSSKKKEKAINIQEEKDNDYVYVEEIVNIEEDHFRAEEDTFVYDVATESEHFEVSGLYSHNCRAFLGPWFKNSNSYIPQDENDEFEIYRCNLGVISLNLPMIIQKSIVENKPWNEVLDYYLELSKKLSLKTIDFLGKKKASSNPLVFCEGGFDGGNLKLDDNISSVLRKSTISFGYWGINECNILMTGKSLVEDKEGKFAIELMKYIDDKINQYKKETNIGFAFYGTPGESSIPWGVQKFIDKYGEVERVTDSGYFTNSFHCSPTEDITPIEKMELESRFWEYPKGGRIMYGRVPDFKNTKAIKDLVRMAMAKGLYYGVNTASDYCGDCGAHFVDNNENINNCPECNSEKLYKIRRMNGYLSYTRTQQGKTRYNDMKDKEIKERKSM